MNTNTTGIHHVTAISGEARRNVAFHVGALGQNLKLPPWLEARSARISAALPTLDVSTKEIR